MYARAVPPGSRGTDSVQDIRPDQAAALRAAGFDFAVRYLHNVTRDEVAAIVAAGLGFMPVTYAGAYNGADAAAQCSALGLPAGVTVWLDLEGQKAFHLDPHVLIATINDWARPVRAANFQPGIYVGVPQPLTSSELFGLDVVRYWRGQGSIRDRFNELAEPKCGWCMYQTFPSHMRCGVYVDVDITQQDYEKRAPMFATASSSMTMPVP